MDALYGLRPANFGREGGLEDDDAVVTSDEEQSQTTTDGSAPSPTQSQAQTPTRAQATPSASATPQRVVLGKRKRREEHPTDLREMLTADLPQQDSPAPAGTAP
ncbi:hypothetical protein OYC64_014446 [Pagothenia borchgrevinki]|uniref:Uncharacterized protein n=1 Tax=Pagothenia borchgrevinki TaxID=8213 RepID=A0ABD2H0T8_PAGBO